MLLSSKCSSEFYGFGFEAVPDTSCYLNSIKDKTPHGPVIVLFCATSAAFLVAVEVSL